MNPTVVLLRVPLRGIVSQHMWHSINSHYYFICYTLVRNQIEENKVMHILFLLEDLNCISIKFYSFSNCIHRMIHMNIEPIDFKEIF